MPNWCNNFVQINHSDPAKIAELAAAINNNRFCDFVIPVPQDLRDTVAGWPGADKEAEHEAQKARNIEKYGVKDWYDFCVSRWGTKWEVDGTSDAEVSEDGKHLSVGFDSAWSPPEGVYAALVEQGFSVDAMYWEPGMCFCGRWVNGDDDYYELGQMTSEEVAAEIDPDLDEQFAISENMAQWEEDNREDEDLNDAKLPPHTD